MRKVRSNPNYQLIKNIFVIGLAISLLLGNQVMASGSPEPEGLREKVEKLASKSGWDADQMMRIIDCESDYDNSSIRKNYRKNKKGVTYLWSRDIGYFQINDYWWQDYFKKRGLDIYDPEDNLKAGVIVWKVQGLKAWNWSKHCWGE